MVIVLTRSRQLHTDHEHRDMMVATIDRVDARELEESTVILNFKALLTGSVHSTASSMSSVLYFLSIRHDVQTKLRLELQEHFQSAEDISVMELPKLPYLNAIVHESLRIFPPIPLLGPRIFPGVNIGENYIRAGVGKTNCGCDLHLLTRSDRLNDHFYLLASS